MSVMNPQPRKAISSGRTIAAGLCALAIASFVSAAFPANGVNYWGSFGGQLLAFSVAGWIAGVIAKERAVIVVAILFGLTWGAISVFVLIYGLATGGAVRAPILVLVYVAAAVATSHFSGHRVPQSQQSSQGDPSD